MKTRPLFALVLLVVGVALGLSGCAQQPILGGSHVPASRPAKTFALAVTLPDGSQPTPAQWAAVKTAFEQQLAAAGATLTDNISLADKIIRVVFTPAEDDPSNGNAMVLSVRDNPAYAFNTSTSLMPVSYASSFGLGYSSAFGPSYYVYYGYNDYYSGGSGAIITPRIEPPTHHRPTQPVDCPPGQERPSRGGDHFAGGSNGSWNRGDQGDHGGTWTRSNDGTRTWTRVDSDGNTRTWTRSTGGDGTTRTWTRGGDNGSGGRTWTRSDNNNGGGRTWTRSEPSYSSSNSSSGSGYSSSSSSSSYSSSSSSSSYSGGSSSSSSDFSSSSSSSPGSFSTSSSNSGGMHDYGASQAER
jgi:hypothetical protein